MVERALERCAVAELADRQLAELSGGERQRARIARALAQEAPITAPRRTLGRTRPALPHGALPPASGSARRGTCRTRRHSRPEPRGPFRRPPAAARSGPCNGPRRARRCALVRSAGGLSTNGRSGSSRTPDPGAIPGRRRRFPSGATVRERPDASELVLPRAAAEARAHPPASRLTPCQEQGTRAPP